MSTKGYDTDAFKRRLARVPAAVRQAVAEANAKSAAEFVAAAKIFVPTDPKDGTPLKDSIRSEATETGGQIVRAGGKTTTKQSAGGSYDYALAQEFGTAKMRARPYFWPAYRLLRKRFVARRKRALTKAMKVFNNG